MVAIRRITTKDNEGVLIFEEWKNEIKPKRKLPKVWVHIFDVPHEIRSFLPLWAVGSILGSTQKVDIPYLRRTGVARVMVAVLDVKAIPEDAEIVVKDSLYEIKFKVDEIVQEAGESFD